MSGSTRTPGVGSQRGTTLRPHMFVNEARMSTISAITSCPGAPVKATASSSETRQTTSFPTATSRYLDRCSVSPNDRRLLTALRTWVSRECGAGAGSSRRRAYSANGANTSGSDRTRWPGTCCPFRYSRTVRRLSPRCRAIADLVQPRAYSACASTVVSHVSIPTGSFDGSGGQRPRASREPTDIRWTPVGGSLKVGSFGEQVWADSDELHHLGRHPRQGRPSGCARRARRRVRLG